MNGYEIMNMRMINSFMLNGCFINIDENFIIATRLAFALEGLQNLVTKSSLFR